ncbi:MAG: hypothetical protein ACOYKE_12315 [Ferruginibacter sp.]
MEKRIKKTYICKDINDYVIDKNVSHDYKPAAGDVGIFEIIKLGKHKNVQSDTRRNMTIIPGDWMMAAFGNRYATAQFEGYVPENLGKELHIIGAGGIIGCVKSMHYDFIDIGPTIVNFIGFAKDKTGNILNTKIEKQNSLSKFTGYAASETKVILSIGSSMDSGKTTSASYLVNGLKRAGHKVAFIKLTGTAYTKDIDLNADLGADVIADFSDFGFPSTYLCDEAELLNLYESLLQNVNAYKPDYTVIEIADGIYQRETMMLIHNLEFTKTVHAILFSAGDSLSATFGINTLNAWGLKPFALSGLFTASPLLIEEVKNHLLLPVPVVTIDELAENATKLLEKNAAKLLNKKLSIFRAVAAF